MKKDVLIILLILILVTLSSQTIEVNAVDEKTSIENANSYINQAFNNVLAAEKAGGNITEFLVKLNVAGELMAGAQNSFQAGDLTNVTSKANNARQIADQVNTAAINLRYPNLVQSQNNFWLTLVFSVAGATVFSISLLFVWRRFKRAYFKKLVTLKPEVVNDTS